MPWYRFWADQRNKRDGDIEVSEQRYDYFPDPVPDDVLEEMWDSFFGFMPLTTGAWEEVEPGFVPQHERENFIEYRRKLARVSLDILIALGEEVES